MAELCLPDVPAASAGTVRSAGGARGAQPARPGDEEFPVAPADVIVVRTPVEADREPVRALCKAMHARTIFGDIAFSDAKFDRGFDALMAGPRHQAGLVAQLNGRIIGACHASAGEYFIGEGAVLATTHFLAVEPDLAALRRAKTFLRLIKGLRLWAQTRNARHLLIHVTTGHDLSSTDRLLKAAGMKIMGGGYVG